MVAAPHPMYPGTTETDYYEGAVTHAAPDLLRAAEESTR
jgi:hypothetical protein